MPISLGFPFAQATPAQRRTLLAAALGWMLDAFDAMLYALVLAHVMRDLGMTKGTAGLLNSLTLLASGIGGVAFGFIADRLGRKPVLLAMAAMSALVPLVLLIQPLYAYPWILATILFLTAISRHFFGREPLPDAGGVLSLGRETKLPRKLPVRNCCDEQRVAGKR